MRRRKWRRKAISRDCISRGQRRRCRRANYKLKMTNVDGQRFYWRPAGLAATARLINAARRTRPESSHVVWAICLHCRINPWLALETRALFGLR